MLEKWYNKVKFENQLTLHSISEDNSIILKMKKGGYLWIRKKLVDLLLNAEKKKD